MRHLRRVLAAPLRWAAHTILLDTRLSNLTARGLLVAWAWVRGVDAPEIPARTGAGEGETA